MTVAVRTDLRATAVRERARAAATPDQARRLLAIALVLEGSSRADAARSTGMDRQTLRSIAARSTGASLQRRRAGWAGRASGAGAAAPAERSAARRAARLPGERPRSGAGRRGALAAGRSVWPVSCADIPPGDRPEADGRAAVRRPLPGAGHGQAHPGARLHPDLGAAPAPQIRSRSARRVQQKTARPDRGRRRREGARQAARALFQDESRIGQKGALTRPSGALARPLLRRRSIGAAAAGRGAAVARGSPKTSATPPPISSPPFARQPGRPLPWSCRRSTPRP